MHRPHEMHLNNTQNIVPTQARPSNASCHINIAQAFEILNFSAVLKDRSVQAKSSVARRRQTEAFRSPFS